MELSEAWTPEITQKEVEEEGMLLDENYNPQPDNNAEKVSCKLYYLKYRQLFVTVINGFVDTFYINPLHVITSQYTIDNLRYKYLNQELRQPVNDAFMEYDQSDYSLFQSDLDLSNIETVKKYGRFLEKLQSQDIYYIELLDRFAVVDTEQETSHTFDSPDHRKKYNIPYQDERFSSL
jgi:hypothetical protein